MNAPEKVFLPDIQATPDGRSMPIERVGIRSVRHPILVARPDGTSHPTVATVDMYVGLPHDVKGTHMSRFLEVLQSRHAAVSLAGMRELMAHMLERLEAASGCVELRFPYFIAKRAPVSGVVSLMDYEVALRAELTGERGYEVTLRVAVPVTSLCPCSKEISEYGAHNQRSHVTIEATIATTTGAAGAVSVESLAAIAEREASCELYGLLKRPDEKHVTERAYDNPKFVEDLVRDIALALERDPGVAAYSVESENFESIHNHSAYARIRRDKRTEGALR
ncbi:MAG: GTP cyclohydrolase I FolE2 [Burkholderiales bacterium]|nr:GTP cyclohydrolase I FolE2 [Burkholderiales bacterium]